MKLAVLIGILAAVECMPRPTPGIGTLSVGVPTGINGQDSVQPEASVGEDGQLTVSNTDTKYNEKQDESTDHQADTFDHDDGHGYSVSGASETNSTSYQSEKETETNKQSLSVGPSGGLKATEDTEKEHEKETKRTDTGKNTYREESGTGTEHSRKYESGSEYSNTTETHDKTNKKEHKEYSLGPDLQTGSTQSQSVTEQHDKRESANGSEFQKEETKDINGNTANRRRSQSSNNYQNENAESSRLQSNSSQTSSDSGNQNGEANGERGSDINDNTGANNGTNQSVNSDLGDNNNANSNGASGNTNIETGISGDENDEQGNGRNGILDGGDGLNVSSNNGTNGNDSQVGQTDFDSNDRLQVDEKTGNGKDTSAGIAVNEKSDSKTNQGGKIEANVESDVNSKVGEGVNSGAKQEVNAKTEAVSDLNTAANQSANAEAEVTTNGGQEINTMTNQAVNAEGEANSGINSVANQSENAEAQVTADVGPEMNAIVPAANTEGQANPGLNQEGQEVNAGVIAAAEGTDAGVNQGVGANSGATVGTQLSAGEGVNAGRGSLNADHLRQKLRFRKHIMKLLDREEKKLGLAKYYQNDDDSEEETHKIADLEKFRKEYLLSVAQNIHKSKITTDRHGRPRVVSPHQYSDETEYLFGLSPHNKYGHKYGHSPISSHYANVQYIEDRFGDLPSLFGSKNIKLEKSVDNLIGNDKETHKNTKKSQIIKSNNSFDNDDRSYTDVDSLFAKANKKYEGNSAVDLQLSPEEWISRFKKEAEHKHHHFGNNRVTKNHGHVIELDKIDPIVKDVILSSNLADILKTAKTPEEVKIAMTTLTDGKERSTLEQKNQTVVNNKQQNAASKSNAKEITPKKLNTPYARNANDIYSNMIQEKPNFDIAETSYAEAKELLKQVKPDGIDFTRDMFGSRVFTGELMENNIDNSRYVTYKTFPTKNEVKGEITDTLEGFTSSVTTDKVLTKETPKTEHVNDFSTKNDSNENSQVDSKDPELKYTRNRYNVSTSIENTTKTLKSKPRDSSRINLTTETNVTASNVEDTELQNRNFILLTNETGTKIDNISNQTSYNTSLDETTLESTNLYFEHTTLRKDNDIKINNNEFDKLNDTAMYTSFDTTENVDKTSINNFEKIYDAKSAEFDKSVKESEENSISASENEFNITSEKNKPGVTVSSNEKGNIKVTTELVTVIQNPLFLNNEAENNSETYYHNRNDINISNTDDINKSSYKTISFETISATGETQIETKNEDIENIYLSVTTEASILANYPTEFKMTIENFTTSNLGISTTQMPDSNDTSITTQSPTQEPKNVNGTTMLNNTNLTTLNLNITNKVTNTELSSPERLYARQAITVGEDDDFSASTAQINSGSETNDFEDVKKNPLEFTDSSDNTSEKIITNSDTEADIFKINHDISNQSNINESTLDNGHYVSVTSPITTGGITETETSGNNNETSIEKNQDDKSVKSDKNSDINTKSENNTNVSNASNKQSESHKTEVNLNTIKSSQISYPDSRTEDYAFKQTVKRGLILDEGTPKSEENDTGSFDYSYTSGPYVANSPIVDFDNQSTTERMGDGYSIAEAVNMSKPDNSTEFTVDTNVKTKLKLLTGVPTDKNFEVESNKGFHITAENTPEITKQNSRELPKKLWENILEVSTENSLEITIDKSMRGSPENTLTITTEKSTKPEIYDSATIAAKVETEKSFEINHTVETSPESKMTMIESTEKRKEDVTEIARRFKSEEILPTEIIKPKNIETKNTVESKESVIVTSKKSVGAVIEKGTKKKTKTNDDSLKAATDMNTVTNQIAVKSRENIDKSMVATSEKSSVTIEKDFDIKPEIVRRARSEELALEPSIKTKNASFDISAFNTEIPIQSYKPETKSTTVEPIKETLTITITTAKPETTVKLKAKSTKKPNTAIKTDTNFTKKPKTNENSFAKGDKFLEAVESDKGKEESRIDIEESASKSEDSESSSSTEQSQYISSSNLESANLDYSEER